MHSSTIRIKKKREDRGFKKQSIQPNKTRWELPDICSRSRELQSWLERDQTGPGEKRHWNKTCDRNNQGIIRDWNSPSHQIKGAERTLGRTKTVRKVRWNKRQTKYGVNLSKWPRGKKENLFGFDARDSLLIVAQPWNYRTYREAILICYLAKK